MNKNQLFISRYDMTNKREHFDAKCVRYLDMTSKLTAHLVSVMCTLIFHIVTRHHINNWFLPRCMECRRGLAVRKLSVCLSVRLSDKRVHCDTRKSSGDEIANVNFLYDDIVHVIQNTIDSCVQGHSRSPILVPIESSYTTSY